MPPRTSSVASTPMAALRRSGVEASTSAVSGNAGAGLPVGAEVPVGADAAPPQTTTSLALRTGSLTINVTVSGSPADPSHGSFDEAVTS